MDIDTLTTIINDSYRLYKTDLGSCNISDKSRIWECIINMKLNRNDRSTLGDRIGFMLGKGIHGVRESVAMLSLVNSRLDPQKIAEKTNNPDTVIAVYKDNNFIEFIRMVDRDALLSWVNETYTPAEINNSRDSGICNFSLTGYSEPAHVSIASFIEQNRQITGGVKHSMSVEELKKVFAK
jgi:hypothetical protein